MNFINSFKTILVFVLIVVLISACNNRAKTSSVDSFKYHNYYSGFSPEFKVYHVSNDSSELHIKINSSELLYAKVNPNSKFESALKITGIIKNTHGELIDTIHAAFSNSAQMPRDQILYSKTTFKLEENANYILELVYSDVKRKIQGAKDIRINKTTKFSEENFLVFTPESKFPKFSFQSSAEFPIKIFSNRIDLTKIETLSRQADLSLPPPPYSKAKGTAPNISGFQQVDFSQTKNELTIEEGEISDIYLKENNEGLIFLIRPYNFPRLTTPSELIKPMRYISSKREFEKMSESNQLKTEIDEFWLECGTSKDRAKTLISNYYQRVHYTNQHFSSFKSGWRTDRGLIYIIYGHPSEIVFNPNHETWIYGGQNSLGSIEFKFNKVENSFSTNHFTLERNPLYKSEWSRRVNAWRNGRIYD